MLRYCVAAAAALLFSSAAHADSYNWSGMVPTGDWDAIGVPLPPPLNLMFGNWFNNTTNSAFGEPGAADDATFGSVAYSPLGVNMNGPHSLNSITFDTPEAFTINNSGGLTTALTLTSGSLTQTAHDSGVQTISVPITIGATANWSLNGSGTIVVSQPVSSNGVRLSLITTGPGNLVLQGQNTYRGGTGIEGSGTVLLTGSIGAAIGGASPQNFFVDSQGGANFVLASSATDTSTLITADTFVGNTQTGTFTQNGGTHIAKMLAVGYGGDSNGTYNLINGALNVTTNATLVGGLSSGAPSSASPAGVFNQSGGVHQTAQLEIGASEGGSGTYNLTAGTLSVSQATFIGETTNSNGLFTQTNGQNTTQALVLGISIQYTSDPIIPGGWSRVINMNGLGTLATSAATSADVLTAAQTAVTARYVLSGGTLTTEAIEGISTGSEFDFNGGTLRPSTNLNMFISGLDAAVVQAGGAVIDTNGFNVTVPQALSHDASLGATPDGGLTKNGNGNLYLTGSATYTGPTVVNGGYLSIPATTGTFSSNSFTSNVGATLQLNGGTVAPGGSIIDNGTVQTTQFDSYGTITIAGGTNAGTFYGDVDALILDTASHTYVGSPATPGGTMILQNGSYVYLLGTLVNNGTITGKVSVNGGGLLTGGGHADTIAVNAEGIIQPGNGLGTIHAGTATLGYSSIFQFDIDSAAGTAGTDWSLLAVDGTLTVGGGFGRQINTLQLISVSGPGDTASPLADFDPSQHYTWEFATFNSLTSIGSNAFQIDTSSFENSLNGGTFTEIVAGNTLAIQFNPAPEPSTASPLWLASLTCLRRRRGMQM